MEYTYHQGMKKLQRQLQAVIKQFDFQHLWSVVLESHLRWRKENELLQITPSTMMRMMMR